MTRDYSLFLPSATKEEEHARNLSPLEALGWQPYFAQQLSVDELTETPPVRITEVHRSKIHVMGDGIDTTVPPGDEVTVGDWALLAPERVQLARILHRKSLMTRRAPGHNREVQMIAANIDTVFIVTSCNNDFNIARLERYLALAFEADVTPVIVLTKTDKCDAPDRYISEAQAISTDITVIALDARQETAPETLAPWCKSGQTVAFLGSSGVGKSTLVNSLSGTQSITTRAIREDDARGRHTTTHRQLHLMPSGCVVMDTPGMRELQMTDVAAGIADVFADISELATQCRFNDCAHASEPGCAVQMAVQAGTIDAARMERWRKLILEDAHNSASLAQRRTKDKNLGKIIRSVKKKNRK